MKYHFNKETHVFTVECDSDKQCEQLTDFLNELSQACHFIYAYAPSDNYGYNTMQCFESLDEAKQAARKEVDLHHRMELSTPDHYTFYEIPLSAQEYEVNAFDNARISKKVATMYVR